MREFVRKNLGIDILRLSILISMPFLSSLILYVSSMILPREYDIFLRYYLSFPLIVGLLIFTVAVLWKMKTNNKIDDFVLAQTDHEQATWLNKYYKLIIFILFATIFSLIYWKITEIDWWVIDDHQIMRFLGKDGRLFFTEILPTYTGITEIAKLGSVQRFRPVYYFFRVLETFLWGGNSRLWFISRFSILFLSIGIYWKILADKNGAIFTSLLILYTMTFPFWIDIFGRLGPSEAYAMLGLAIFCWGFSSIVQSNEYGTDRYWIATAIGSFICFGAKENFLILILPIFYLIVLSICKRKSFVKNTLPNILSLVFSLFVFFVVSNSLTQDQTDVYNQSISISDRLSTLVIKLNSLRFYALEIPLMTILVVLIMFFTIYALIRKNDRYSILLPNVKTNLLWLAVIVLIYFSQFYFYNFSWPSEARYSFPGLLVIPATILIVYRFLVISIKLIYKNQYIDRVFQFVSILILVLIVSVDGYHRVQNKIDEQITITNQFTTSMQEIIDYSRNNPETSLVIESHDVWDYEPIYSWSENLQLKGVNNPLYLRVYYSINEDNLFGLELSLATTMINLSKNGGANISPLEEFDQNITKCLSIELSGNSDTLCEKIIKVY